jgi:two-component system, sensor histidine kinase SagS
MSPSHLKILLVDDEASARLLLVEILEGWGHSVIPCSSALEALALLQADPDIQVLLTDWLMPELDGVELCKLARQVERKSYLHILLLTARSEKENVVAALQSGADAFVTKSADHSEIFLQLKVVMRLVSQGWAMEQAKRTAEEASRVKSEFLANLSHEIRTPMHGVLGMVDHLLGTPLNQEQNEYACLIQQSAQNLLVILNDLLDFSKIESGQMEFEHIPMDPAQVATEALTPFLTRAQERGIALMGVWPDHLPATVIGDPSRYRQVLTNLVSNATKFTSEGSVTLRLEVQGQELVARVIDTGCGMTQQQQEVVFLPFTQAHLSVQRLYGGTGLGLAIVQRLVGLMGGTISLLSEAGQGTQVEVRLPMQQPTPPRHDAPPVSECVLLLSERSPYAELVREQLQQWGWKVNPTNGSKPTPVAWAVAESDQDWSAWRDQAEVVLLPTTARLNDLPPGVHVCARPITSSSLRHAFRRVRDSAPVAAATVRAEHRTLDVLVAEDNPIGLTVVKLLLEKSGCRVTTVVNGEDAARMAVQGEFDLALLDVQMPGWDGKEAARYIRAQEQHLGKSRLPIAALTAQAFDRDRDACLAAGMDYFLTKPLRKEDLTQILDALR